MTPFVGSDNRKRLTVVIRNCTCRARATAAASGACGSRSAIDADVRQHSGIALPPVARQAPLAIENGEGLAACGRHVDDYVVGFARQP